MVEEKHFLRAIIVAPLYLWTLWCYTKLLLLLLLLLLFNSAVNSLLDPWRPLTLITLSLCIRCNSELNGY